MKPLWLLISLLFIPGWNEGPLKRAGAHFAEGRYQTSIDAYLVAINDYPLRSREIRYNIAQCYERMDSLDKALEYYHQSVNVRKPILAAKASNQIGLILLQEEKSQQALSAWKQALKYDPTNETARYNYELLLKRMEPELDQQAEIPPAPTDPQAEEAGEGEMPIPDGDVQQRRRRIAQWLKQYRRPPSGDDAGSPTPADTLSLPQAREILDAMRENETRFLQQLRKTAKNNMRPKDRPDW